VNHQDKTAENIDLHDPRIVESIDRYWRKNMLIMVLLLIIWAVVGLGCGVLLADRLNHFALGGFPLCEVVKILAVTEVTFGTVFLKTSPV